MNSSLADSPSNQSREILSAHPGKSAQKIIPGLDGLRGVAILGVLGFHFSNESGFARIFKPFHVGWIGVDLFFVISGFLITGILLDARNAPKYFSNFYARRALRIFPLYYVFLLAMLLIYKISGNRIIPHLDRTVATWPWWVFYGANYLVARRGWIFPAMGLFWSLAVEEHFYLCWPTVIRFIRPRLLPWIIYALIAGSLALRCIAWRCGVRNSLFFYTLTPCRLEGLCIGAGLAVVYKNRGLESIRTWTRAFIILGTAGFVLAILWSWDTSFNGHKMSTFGFFFLDLMCGGIMATAVTAAPKTLLYRILNGRILAFFGKYSYGLYIIHPLVVTAAANLLLPILRARFHASILVPLTFAALCMVTTILLALASWNLLEKHALTLKRYFGK